MMRKKSVLACIVLLVAVISCSRGEKEGESGRDSVPTLSMVREAGRLELAEMTISKMGTIDDLKPEQAEGIRQTALALFNKIKIGERKGAYSYDTYMRAYVDLSSLTPESLTVDSVERTATLRLPPIQTELAGRDVVMREEHYRVTGLRSEISAEERARLKEEMNGMLRSEVAANKEFVSDLKKQAADRAVSYFEALFAAAGYSVTVVVN